MSRFLQRRWPANPTALGGRRARAAFSYQAFVPDPIGNLGLSLPMELAEAVGRAEGAVRHLNENPPQLGLLEVLARRLLRSESVASSRIEGLELSQRRLAKAEVSGDARDETARSVLANIAAMEAAVALGGRRNPLRPADVQALHQTLMEVAGIEPGTFRSQQNWIGGNPYNPNGADFVPPPEDRVEGLVADLCQFLNRPDLPTLVQAAVGHAQFETIHPFADGNGRVGRALIHVVLRRRGVAPRYVPPISLVLAGSAKAYIQGLNDFRKGDLLSWLRFFVGATEVAAQKSLQLAGRFHDLQERWLEKAGRPRSDSSTAALLRLLPAYPLLDVATAQSVLKRSKQAANEAVASLEHCSVLKRVNVGKRNRAWEAKEVFELLNAFERELATPSDGGPARHAPRAPS